MTNSCAIIARSSSHANALKLWAIPLLKAGEEASVLILDRHGDFETWLQQLIEYIENFLGDRENRPHDNLTLFVDTLDPGQMSITRERSSADQSIAATILCYPDVRWLVSNLSSQPPSDLAAASLGTRLACVASPLEGPLYDPSGLREWIRRLTNENLKSMVANAEEAFQLPERHELAVVIEDEVDYALMHGYAAYRFGFRTDMVTSWSQMKERFHVESPVNPSPDPQQKPAKLTFKEQHNYRLILEDMRLQFADKSADTHLSDLEERGIHCNRLADENDDSDFRFMISTGQESSSSDLWETNRAYLRNKVRGIGSLFSKPIGGPFELWRTTELYRLLENGKAKDFVSPPIKIREDLYSGHGAPGKLALVARKLIERARLILASGLTVSDFILAAVLANDAFELLGGKTPALSLEAIKIKHAAEVRAECSFVGAGFHFDLQDRFKEINEFVHATCRWYHPSVRSFAELDARATICNELVKIYTEAGQSEEQDACLAQFRWNNRRLELSQSMAEWSLLGLALNSVLLYAELLLVSLNRILFAFGLWVMAFCGITFLATRLYAIEQTEIREFPVLIATQLNWMIGGSANGISSLGKTASDQELMLALISIGANIVGVFHFGILISYFYSLISRK